MARKKKIDTIENEVINKVHKISHKFTFDNLNSQISELAETWEICALYALPLISSSKIEFFQEGYRIGINSDLIKESDKNNINNNQIEKEKWDNLPSFIRFSILHEIAHIIVLNESGLKPDDKFFKDNFQRIENLCDKVAAALILPKHLLETAIKAHQFTIESINNILSKFNVSPSALINRLRNLEKISELFGTEERFICQANLDFETNRVVIKKSNCFAHGGHTSGRLKNADTFFYLDDFLGNSIEEELLRKNIHNKSLCFSMYDKKLVQSFIFGGINLGNSRQRFLLTVEITDDPSPSQEPQLSF